MLETLREQVCSACHMMYDNGLAAFMWGNISGIDRANSLVVITPKGLALNEITPESLVICDLYGNVAEGDFLPSVDLAAHIALYRAFENIGGVVHTHSKSATVWAQAGRDIPPYGISHADFFKGAIPCTRSLTISEIESEYEETMGRSIVETFLERGLDPDSIPGALVFNHGPFAWGTDCIDALKHAAALETIAELAYRTERINPEIMPINKAILEKQFLK
ncbi:MAG: class II aldolase/adducin family protein [Clostridia bacterium]|nr:class II aldolase/adducin family protein [Clostridia bacterium]